MTELLGPAPIPSRGPAPVVPDPVLRHSGPGIASFVMSLVCALVVFATLVYAAMLYAHHDGVVDEQSPTVIMVGLVMMLFLFIALIGGALGVVGVVQKHRRKLFAWLGLGINALTVLGTISLIILGNSNP